MGRRAKNETTYHCRKCGEDVVLDLDITPDRAWHEVKVLGKTEIHRLRRKEAS